MAPSYVVVGMDFTTLSVEAARWAAAHLSSGSELVLAHAINVPQPPSFLRGLHAPIEPLVEDARRGADLRMRELTTSLGGGRIWPEVRVGRPDDVLASIADEYRALLVVIGPHGARPGIGRFLGGTAERVVRQARSSVLLARGLPAGAPRSILVALDESDVTDAVIRWGSQMAKGQGAAVTVMHVVNPLLAGAVAVAAATPERERAETQLREGSEKWLRETIAGTPLEGAAIEVAFGSPGFAILAAADRIGADMIVVGRMARGQLAALGSTAGFVVRNGTGPVLVAASPGG